MCEGVPRQNAAESRKIPESGSVIPREGVESMWRFAFPHFVLNVVIPREGVESFNRYSVRAEVERTSDPERGS